MVDDSEGNAKYARLLGLEGRSPVEIARLLNEPLVHVLQWLSSAMPEVPVVQPADNRSEQRQLSDRRATAKMALSRPSFLTVASGDDVLGDADVGVGIWDPLATELSDIVDESTRFIRSYPGVRQVEREDKEFIAVYGNVIDCEKLRDTLTAWWKARLVLIALGE